MSDNVSHKFKVGDKIVYINSPGFVDEVLELLPKNGWYKLKNIKNPNQDGIGIIFDSAKNIDPQNRLLTPLDELL